MESYLVSGVLMTCEAATNVILVWAPCFAVALGGFIVVGKKLHQKMRRKLAGQKTESKPCGIELKGRVGVRPRSASF